MKLTNPTILFSYALLLCLPVAAFAQNAPADVAAGEKRAAVCFACHGKSGRAILPEYPNLAGQNRAYLEKALRGYQTGTRTDPVMGPMAKPLSEADIRNIAAYFASLPR